MHSWSPVQNRSFKIRLSNCLPSSSLHAELLHLNTYDHFYFCLQFVLVVQLLSCVQLCDSMECSMPVFPVLHHFPKLLKFMSIELVMPSNHLILCHPLFLLTSIFPSIRVFSNELALCIR